MEKFVRIIDENGLFIDERFVEELTEFTIEEPCPVGFYLPQWNGEEWQEGLTEEELQERKDEAEAEKERTPDVKKMDEELNAVKVMARRLAKDEEWNNVTLLSMKAVFLKWKPEIEVKEFEYYNYKDNLYQVSKGKGHTTQLDWTPDIMLSNFNKVLPPGEIGEWEQPLGGHDAYQLGDRVLFEGKTYVSVYEGKEDNNNVWQPDIAGWEEV